MTDPSGVTNPDNRNKPSLIRCVVGLAVVGFASLAAFIGLIFVAILPSFRNHRAVAIETGPDEWQIVEGLPAARPRSKRPKMARSGFIPFFGEASVAGGTVNSAYLNQPKCKPTPTGPEPALPLRVTNYGLASVASSYTGTVDGGPASIFLTQITVCDRGLSETCLACRSPGTITGA